MGLRYQLNKYGEKNWGWSGDYTLRKRRGESVLQSVYSSARVFPESRVSKAQKENVQELIEQLKGKNAQEGIAILKNIVHEEVRGVGAKPRVAGSEEKDISYLIEIESSLSKQKVNTAEECASWQLFENGQSFIPEGYSLKLNNGYFLLSQKEQIVRSSEKMPVHFCSFAGLAAPGSILKTASFKGAVRINFYRYPDESVCIEGIDQDASIEQTLAAVRSAVKNQNL